MICTGEEMWSYALFGLGFFVLAFVVAHTFGRTVHPLHAPQRPWIRDLEGHLWVPVQGRGYIDIGKTARPTYTEAQIDDLAGIAARHPKGVECVLPSFGEEKE